MKMSHPPILVVLLIMFSSFLHADRITVHNWTPRDLHYAIYYIGMKLPWMKEHPKAKLATPIQLLETESSGILERPSRKIGYDRELVFVEAKELLKPELMHSDLKKYNSKNVGDLQGDVFYIGDKDGEFYGYTTVEWNVIKPILEGARNKVVKELTAIHTNPYKNAIAKVREGNDLSAGEKAYLAKRMPRVKSTLEKLLGKSVSDSRIPKIAFVCSGGGYRSMLFTIGALLGAQKSGILDASTYMVGLSGSTWAIGGWVLSGKSIQSYHDWLVSHVNHGLKHVDPNDARLMGQHLLTKYFCEQPYDVVDIYGTFLANELFTEYKNNKQRQTLSSQAKRVESGALPFPIYTAIAAESIAAENDWYEFNPYEVGCTWLTPRGLYVPSWAFGRKFKNGTSVNYAPEQNFGVLLGTWGLAIGITLARLIAEIGLHDKIDSLFVKNIIERILHEYGQKRFTSADFFNFSYQISNSKMRTTRILRMVDAGINFNLPYPPISGQRSERKADIIVFVDASGGKHFGNELKRAQEYAQKNGLKFPVIDYTDLNKKAVSVFKDENDSEVPVVIYVSRIVDQKLFTDSRMAKVIKDFEYIKSVDMEKCIQSGPCSTFNFKYTQKEARMLTDLGALNMLAAKDDVLQAIQWKIDTMAGGLITHKV